MIALGAEVRGRDGKLGTVTRLIVDPEHDRVTDVVVKQGTLMPVERVVPLPELVPGEDRTAFLDVSERAFEEYAPFSSEGYREPAPDYGGPPGWDAASMGMDAAEYRTAIMFSPGAYGNVAPVVNRDSFDASEPLPDLAAIHKGSDVFDVLGEKVGEVFEIATNEQTGMPERLVVRQGRIFRHEREVPVHWLQDVQDDALVLNRRKDEVERLAG